MRPYLLIIFFSSLLFSCTSLDVATLSQKDLLQISYEEESEDYLKLFLERWHNEIHPIKIDDIESDTVKVIYDVFNSIYNPIDKYFYHPNNPNIGKDSNIENMPDFSNLYVIIQDQVNFSIVNDSLFTQWAITDYDTLMNFRPEVSFSSRVVYLTSDYEKLFDDFLGEDNNGEFINKMAFARRLVNISPSRGRNSTYPFINIIILNSSFDKAKVGLNFLFAGDIAILQMEDDNWKIVSIEQIFIE